MDLNQVTAIDQLETHFQKIHDQFANKLIQQGAKIRSLAESVEPLPFFLWIRDDAEAIFLFTKPGLSGQGIAFRTTDADILRIFTERFYAGWNLSTTDIGIDTSL